MLKSPDFEEVDKNQLVPILLQAPKNSLKMTAELVTKHWIEQKKFKKRYIYNLAFHLLVKSVLACETSEEVSQQTQLTVFLHDLDYEQMTFNKSEDDETLDVNFAMELLQLKLKEKEVWMS